MGKSNSKSVSNTGDPQVVVLNQLEAHAEMHDSHDIKLTIILVIVSVQLVAQAYILWRKHSRRQALRAAKSVLELQKV